MKGERGNQGNQGNRGNPGETGEQGIAGGLTNGQYRALCVLGLCILALFVVGLGAIKISSDSSQNDIEETQAQIKDTQVSACKRSAGERKDNLGLERDVRTFSASSVKFRKSQGQFKLAKESQGIVDRTKKRAASRRKRIVNCEAFVRSR